MKGEKAQDIGERTFRYALRVVRLYQFLQKQRDGAAKVLGRQYLRSGTSIGANVQEAQAGESRADFVHKYSIAQKEARESLYWLRLLGESSLVPKTRLTPLLKETEEILAILTAILVKTKRKSPR